MEYKITKIRKYGKGLYQSEKIGMQWYNVVYAHIIDKTKGLKYKVHFIYMFDYEDLYDYYNNGRDEDETEQGYFSEEDIKFCRNELIWAAAESIFDSDDIKQIVSDCNETIERYA